MNLKKVHEKELTEFEMVNEMSPSVLDMLLTCSFFNTRWRTFTIVEKFLLRHDHFDYMHEVLRIVGVPFPYIHNL